MERQTYQHLTHIQRIGDLPSLHLLTDVYRFFDCRNASILRLLPAGHFYLLLSF